MGKIFRLSILVSCCFIFSKVNSQQIGIGYGVFYEKTYHVEEIVNGDDCAGGNTDGGFVISASIPIKARFALLGDFSQIDGQTIICYEKGGFIQNGTEFRATGWSGTKLRRLNIMAAFNLLPAQLKTEIKGYAGFGIQQSKTKNIGIFPTIASGPKYFASNPIQAQSFENVQLTPIIGTAIQQNIGKRLGLGVNFQYTLAFKTVQRLSMEYSYLTEIKPDGIYESKGTGLQAYLTLSYSFKKRTSPKRKTTKRK